MPIFVVLSVVLSILLAMLLYVPSSADATLVEMAVSHHRVTIELSEWQCASALEATFHDQKGNESSSSFNAG